MELSSNIAKALSAVPCLECGKPYRLPDDVGEVDSIECPHCHANLMMSDILEKLAEEFQVPKAAVVKARTKPEEKTGEESTQAEPEIRRTIDDGDFFIPKPLKTATRHRELSKGEIRRRRHLRQKGRSFEKKKGGPGEWMRVALGAVLALPIAQMALWWVFGVDPFGLAPRIAQVAPIVVPAKLEGRINNDDAPVAADKDMPENQTLYDQGVPASLKSGGN